VEARQQMKTSDIAAELNRAFAAARVNALMGGVDLGNHKKGPRAFGNARQYSCATFHSKKHEQKATAALNVAAVLPFHKTLA
jgi:polyisoprenoid-binding protein YceI